MSYRRRPPGTPAISLVGDFGWDTTSPPTLVDVNLEVTAGQLVVVVGPTGGLSRRDVCVGQGKSRIPYVGDPWCSLRRAAGYRGGARSLGEGGVGGYGGVLARRWAGGVQIYGALTHGSVCSSGSWEGRGPGGAGGAAGGGGGPHRWVKGGAGVMTHGSVCVGLLVLVDVSLEVQAGRLVVVVGPTGGLKAGPRPRFRVHC